MLMPRNLRNPLEEAAMVEVIARVLVTIKGEAAVIRAEIAAVVEAATMQKVVVAVAEQEEIISIQQQKSQVRHHLRPHQ